MVHNLKNQLGSHVPSYFSFYSDINLHFSETIYYLRKMYPIECNLHFPHQFRQISVSKIESFVCSQRLKDETDNLMEK